jgi:hypothetical protein
MTASQSGFFHRGTRHHPRTGEDPWQVGQIAGRLIYSDLIILDELSSHLLNASGGALLSHLFIKLNERTSVVTPQTSASSNGRTSSATP